MAGKRFFWLKLQEDFFQQKAMKKLRRMEHGEVLTIVYLKMQLASLRNGGAIAFEGMDGSLAEELSYQIDEPEQDVQTTIDFLVRYGLMEQVNGSDLYILPKAVENTGSEGDSAARMRALRERQASHCDGETSLCSDIKRESKTEPYLELYQEREKDPAAAPPAPAPQDPKEFGFGPDLTAAFADWLKYKREKRQEYKPTGLTALVSQVRNNAAKYGEAAVAALIRQCMAANWQGIIWDKLEKPPAPPGGGKPGKHTTQDFQPTPERIQKNAERLDAFLAEQEGKSKDWNLPGVTRL